MEDLHGKTAVITGGASGIGLATARQLADKGVNLCLADIEAERLAGAVDELGAMGVKVHGVQTDVTKFESVTALADEAFDHFGSVHIVFNNAGIAVFGPIAETSHDDWRWTIDVDLWGPIHGAEAFTQRLIDQGEGGHIINTASFAGFVPNHGLGAYCVAKYGVVALSEVLRRELKRYEIGVSVLCPMQVSTNINEGDRNRQHDYGGPQDEPPVEPAEGDVGGRLGESDQVAGRLIEAADAASLVVWGIEKNELYLFTHPESREFVQRRFGRIDAAFDKLPI